MTHDLHHLAAAYALDALDPAERAAFEAHYPSCEICSTEVAEFRETAAVLAVESAAAPPAELKERVMAEITQTRQLSPLSPANELPERRSSRWKARTMAAVAAALVLVLGAAALLRSGPSDFAEVADAADAAFVTLEGDAGQIEAIWSAERDQVALSAASLAAAGDGLTYALWLFVDDAVVPAGLFHPDANGQLKAVLDLDDVGGTAWGVTIEPAGGSPQPTGDVLFVGQV